jgi:enamine deaminase RidA (YjgF/YER057c/UK114 family)
VAFVHLYLADMGHFSAANAVYSALLPAASPPGRACVQLPLPAGCPVAVSVHVLCGGSALAAADDSGGSSGSWKTASHDSYQEQLTAGQNSNPAAAAAAEAMQAALQAAHQQAVAATATADWVQFSMPATGAAAVNAVEPAAEAAAAQLGRRALHVQSVSEWAPCMIGPYSQGIAAAGLVFMSGVIPLDPPTMQLFPGGFAC